jgi:DNA gyrase/topoisomerase IV subunit A
MRLKALQGLEREKLEAEYKSLRKRSHIISACSAMRRFCAVF